MNKSRVLIPSRASIDDIEKMAAAGVLTGAERIEVSGFNPDVGAMNVEDIWSPGGERVEPTVATLLEILSDNAADTLLGAGARTIRLTGVDENWESQIELVNMDGVNPVATTKTWLRINLPRVADRGSYTTKNLGTITIRAAGGGDVFNEIPVDATFGGAGRSLSSHFAVPANKIAFVYHMLINTVSSKDIELALEIRTNADEVVPPFTGTYDLRYLWKQAEHLNEINLHEIPIFLPEKTDFSFKGKTTQANGSVSIDYAMLMVDKPGPQPD